VQKTSENAADCGAAGKREAHEASLPSPLPAAPGSGFSQCSSLVNSNETRLPRRFPRLNAHPAVVIADLSSRELARASFGLVK